MDFSQKLDFMMNLTKTTNIMLARHISLDASHISRLRTGSRRPAKNADYIRSMAAYFAKHCRGREQLEVITATINKTTEANGEMMKPEELIRFWLCAEEQNGLKPIGLFLDNLSKLNFRKMPTAGATQVFQHVAPAADMTEIFYGTEGKREAVAAFLSEIITQEVPRTLLLFSEENFDWLTENREFAVVWASLLQQVLMKGNRIKIIHNISRHLDEMLAGISEWVPIYMTGMVEPYYYPKTRDGIFQRTIFIAPGIAAVLSTSVTGRTSKTANYFVRDKKAVDAAVAEFNDYFELCKPLLHVFRAGNTDGLIKTLKDFSEDPANTIIKSSALSIMTMPEEAAAESCRCLPEADCAAMLENHRIRIQQFNMLIGQQQFHEIIKMPDFEKLRQGKLKIIASDFLLRKDIYYTMETFKRHLEHMISLLKLHDNYHVYIDEVEWSEDVVIYAREDIGVLVAKNSLPSVLFAINESKMTAAFWDYLNGFIGKDLCSPSNKKRVIERLETVLQSL